VRGALGKALLTFGEGFAECGTRQSLRRGPTHHSAKETGRPPAVLFAECLALALGKIMIFSKQNSLSSALWLAFGKATVFAESQQQGTRQSHRPQRV